MYILSRLEKQSETYLKLDLLEEIWKIFLKANPTICRLHKNFFFWSVD